MTVLPGEVEFKGTGEVILAVLLTGAAQPWGRICRVRKGFRGFGCTGKSAQMSVLVVAFSWRRRVEVSEAAKMLTLCLLHGRQPSPSEDLLHLDREYEQALANCT